MLDQLLPRQPHEDDRALSAPIKRLHELFTRYAARRGDAALGYLSGQYFADLVTWYHLVWTGETVRRERRAGRPPDGKGRSFTHADRMRAVRADRRRCCARSCRATARSRRAGGSSSPPRPHYHPLGAAAARLPVGARGPCPTRRCRQRGGYPGGTRASRCARRSRRSTAMRAASARAPRASGRPRARCRCRFCALLATHGRALDRQRREGVLVQRLRKPRTCSPPTARATSTGRTAPAADGIVVLLPRRPALRPDRLRVREAGTARMPPRTSSASSRRSPPPRAPTSRRWSA